MDTVYWATGLTPVYLEGALRRALHPLVRPVARPPAAPAFDGPAPDTIAESPAVESILNPFSVYRKGEALLRRPDPFLTALTEKLLTYAVGRGLASYDAPAVRAITREAARRDYAFSSIVLGIVNSVPFQMRRSAGASH